MQAVRDYLIGIVAAGLICGCVRKLMPAGSVGAVTKMLCGVLMALAAVGPLMKTELSQLEDFSSKIQDSAQDHVSDGENKAQLALREGITSQVQAYILDKAAVLGAELTVEVELTDDKLPVPCGVKLQGQISPYAKTVLSEYLQKELGIKTEAQQWIC